MSKANMFSSHFSGNMIGINGGVSAVEEVSDGLSDVLNNYLTSETCVDTSNNYLEKRNKIVNAYNKLQFSLSGAQNAVKLAHRSINNIKEASRKLE